MDEDEKGVVRELMEWGTDTEFDIDSFRTRMETIKSAARDGLMSSLLGGEEVHMDPHPGNILVMAKGKDAVLFMTDLGAEVSLNEKEHNFLGALLAGLYGGGTGSLDQAVAGYFGAGHSSLNWDGVMKTEMKFRPVAFLDELSRNGLDVSLELHELLFSLVKADQLMEIE